MGTLLQVGLPVVDALDSLKDSSTLRAYSKLYTYLHDNISEGKSFQQCFDEKPRYRKYIPTPIQGLITVGERSGRLSKIFMSISETFEAKTELTTKNLSVILEPVLLVIVWLGVVAVALAIILPIYSLVGGISKKPTVNRPARVVAINSPVIVGTSTLVTSTMLEIASPPTTSELQIVSNTLMMSNVVMPIMSVPTSTLPGYSALPSVQVLENSLGYLNIRSEPDAKSILLQKATIGAVFNYLEKRDGWYKIILSADSYGWVSSKYVKIMQ